MCFECAYLFVVLDSGWSLLLLCVFVLRHCLCVSLGSCVCCESVLVSFGCVRACVSCVVLFCLGCLCCLFCVFVL